MDIPTKRSRSTNPLGGKSKTKSKAKIKGSSKRPEASEAEVEIEEDSEPESGTVSPRDLNPHIENSSPPVSLHPTSVEGLPIRTVR